MYAKERPKTAAARGGLFYLSFFCVSGARDMKPARMDAQQNYTDARK